MVNHYLKRLSRAEAEAKFEAALAALEPARAARIRGGVEWDAPMDSAFWLRQRQACTSNEMAIIAYRDASLALLGYHNTLVAESIAAEERATYEAAERERDLLCCNDDAWARRERPPERLDDVTLDEIGGHPC